MLCPDRLDRSDPSQPEESAEMIGFSPLACCHAVVVAMTAVLGRIFKLLKAICHPETTRGS